jgi:hypothetical protein
VQPLCWNSVLRRGRSANRRTVTVSTPSGANNAWLATVALDVSGTASIGHQARQRTPATVDAITIQSGLVRRGDPCPFAGVCPARSGSGVWLAHVAITRAGSGAGAGRSLMTAAAAEIKSTREEPENHVPRRERRRRCLPASARLPARKMPAPRGGSAAGAAALMGRHRAVG